MTTANNLTCTLTNILTNFSALPTLVQLSQYTPVALSMIKVLCTAQACGSLIGNLCKCHALFGKVPGNFRYVTRN